MTQVVGLTARSACAERDVQRHGRWRSRASMDPYSDAAWTFDATNPTHWLT